MPEARFPAQQAASHANGVRHGLRGCPFVLLAGKARAIPMSGAG